MESTDPAPPRTGESVLPPPRALEERRGACLARPMRYTTAKANLGIPITL